MEYYLNSPHPEVLPKPIVVPEIKPIVEPHEDDPFNVPAPKVNPTPKGKKVFKLCNFNFL